MSKCCAFVLALVTCAPLAAEAPRQKAGKVDREYLQGVWLVVKATGFADKETTAEMREVKLVIKGDRITAKWKGKTAAATYKLSPTKDPRQIDITVTDGPEEVKGKTFQGIYLLEGFVLRIAYRDPGQPRPGSFDVAVQKGVHEVTLERSRAATR